MAVFHTESTANALKYLWANRKCLEIQILSKEKLILSTVILNICPFSVTDIYSVLSQTFIQFWVQPKLSSCVFIALNGPAVPFLQSYLQIPAVTFATPLYHPQQLKASSKPVHSYFPQVKGHGLMTEHPFCMQRIPGSIPEIQVGLKKKLKTCTG